ncbi:unnamed protein product [Ascophyllum nodosum]
MTQQGGYALNNELNFVGQNPKLVASDSYDDEDDLRCCVCGYDMPFDDNDIVACSGCPVVVHQNCYGIKTSTKNGDWFCRACLHDLPPTTALQCELCPFKGVSAVANTSDGKWVHGHCSSWLLKMDPDQHENMDMSLNPVTDKCETCTPDKCSECLICGQGSKVQRCGADGCRKHFHPWCMSHHSGIPERLVYWGHFNRNTEIEALIPYHYCHEHRDRVPDASRDDVMWHLESKQITRNRRATEVTDEMRRLNNIAESREKLKLPSAVFQGPGGDVAHATAVSMCNTAMVHAQVLRVSRALDHAMAVVAIVAKRVERGRRGRDHRMKVAKELPLALAETSFLAAHWLLQLMPFTKKWPSNVERKAREIQAHLSALRALCQGLLEKMRVGPDIMASAPLPGSAGSMGWKELRALNRIMALRGRDDIVAREDRCVRCMVKTQPDGEDGPAYIPRRCKVCGVKRHGGCDWMGRKHACGLCMESDRLVGHVVDDDMAALHARLLDNPAASPYWLKPPMIDAEDASKAVQALSTPLHDAARAGRYELLSMMLHHSRGRGLLPAACLALDGNGKTAFDVATANNETECVRLFATTFSDLPEVKPCLGWKPGLRSGKDISGGREGIAIPWVNEVDDEPFPRWDLLGSAALSFVYGFGSEGMRKCQSDRGHERVLYCILLYCTVLYCTVLYLCATVVVRFFCVSNYHTFTYINRVVEGHGASFNWRLCYDQAPDKNPSACHHRDPDDSGGNGGSGGGGSGGGIGYGAPTGFGGGGGMAGAGGAGGASLPLQGQNGCDSVKCGHVARGNENGRRYECNYKCPCAEETEDCGLRPSQLGVTAPLEVFKTPNKGWGVRATATIELEEYICTYAGELIPESAYQAREPEYEKRDQGQGACYCFNVYTDKKNPENNMVVDADRYRGVAALFNHSCCKANVKVRKLVANNSDPRYPIHGFFALNKIVVKEGFPKPELVFNYGAKEKPHPCLCSACEERKLAAEVPPGLR